MIRKLKKTVAINIIISTKYAQSGAGVHIKPPEAMVTNNIAIIPSDSTAPTISVPKTIVKMTGTFEDFLSSGVIIVDDLLLSGYLECFGKLRIEISVVIFVAQLNFYIWLDAFF